MPNQPTYTVKLYCHNCHFREKVEIPMGTSVSEWCQKNPTCPNCGCERSKG